MGTESVIMMLYTLTCTIMICAAFQVGFLLKAMENQGEKLSFKYFIGVYVFLFYLLLAFRVTGMGTVWDIGRQGSITDLDRINLVPFAFESMKSSIFSGFIMLPLGFLLPTFWTPFRDFKKVALTGACLSVFLMLSQWLSHGGININVLILNTLGVIAGFWLFRLANKKDHVKPTSKYASPIIKNEAFFYIASSFIGMFIFYNTRISQASITPQSVIRNELFTEWPSLNRGNAEENKTTRIEVVFSMAGVTEEIMNFNPKDIQSIQTREVYSNHEEKVLVINEEEVQRWDH